MHAPRSIHSVDPTNRLVLASLGLSPPSEPRCIHFSTQQTHHIHSARPAATLRRVRRVATANAHTHFQTAVLAILASRRCVCVLASSQVCRSPVSGAAGAGSVAFGRRRDTRACVPPPLLRVSASPSAVCVCCRRVFRIRAASFAIFAHYRAGGTVSVFGSRSGTYVRRCVR